MSTIRKSVHASPANEHSAYEPPRALYDGNHVIDDYLHRQYMHKRGGETTSPIRGRAGNVNGDGFALAGKDICIIGGGISGLSAALLLKLNGAKVTLMEQNSECGGHAKTVDIPRSKLSLTTESRSESGVGDSNTTSSIYDDDQVISVDIGFQVFNFATYNHFVALLASIGIDSEPSDMSFSFSKLRANDGRRCHEWGSRDFNALLASVHNLWRPGFLRMIYDVFRFSDDIDKALQGTNEKLTVDEFLDTHKYCSTFIDDYFLPMCASIWSASDVDVRKYPIKWLGKFWKNHYLLDIISPRPTWRVVSGNSRSYVQQIERFLNKDSDSDSTTTDNAPDDSADKCSVWTSCDVMSVKSRAGKGMVVEYQRHGSERESKIFDEVVLATHSDTSMKLLKGDNNLSDFSYYLNQIPYNDNEVVLHTDSSFMPSDRRCWASWNYTQVDISESSKSPKGKGNGKGNGKVCVSYWLNVLQNLPEGTIDIFATLNPSWPVDEDKIIDRFTMAHPAFGVQTSRAQSSIKSIQGFHNLWLAGAWLGYGFHEDGVVSAVHLVQQMGGFIPWTHQRNVQHQLVAGSSSSSSSSSSSPKMSLTQYAAYFTFDAFCNLSIPSSSPISLRLILPSGVERLYGCQQRSHGRRDSTRKDECIIRVLDPEFFQTVLTKQDIGLGEAYFTKMIHVNDISKLMDCLVSNINNISKSLKNPLFATLSYYPMKAFSLLHNLRNNTMNNSKRNIKSHYDIGNDLYMTFLDCTMTYSCGYHVNGADTPLEEAQLEKLNIILSRACCPSDDDKTLNNNTNNVSDTGSARFDVLEIGCGWGSLAIQAAERSQRIHVTGITLSRNQLVEARERVSAAGLTDRITLYYLDYRELKKKFGTRSFDAVISIEMIEAMVLVDSGKVGEANLNTYFECLSSMVKVGGKIVIQAISIPDDRYKEYCNSSDFIKEYIFPGGHLPCKGRLTKCARGQKLSDLTFEDIGPHYAYTLRAWRVRFVKAHYKIINDLGFDDKFFLMWVFYFAYCESAFRYKHLHDFIMTCTQSSK